MMYKISFYVPESHLESVKEALFKKGAGRIGLYDKCAWQTKGQGQFRPLKGSDPYKGTTGKVEKVEEFLVEMVCEKNVIKEVLKELVNAHPYEEPAYSAFEVKILSDF